MWRGCLRRSVGQPAPHGRREQQGQPSTYPAVTCAHLHDPPSTLLCPTPCPIPQEEEDTAFAASVVQALNLILLTSSQLQVGSGWLVVAHDQQASLRFFHPGRLQGEATRRGTALTRRREGSGAYATCMELRALL